MQFTKKLHVTDVIVAVLVFIQIETFISLRESLVKSDYHIRAFFSELECLLDFMSRIARSSSVFKIKFDLQSRFKMVHACINIPSIGI